MADLDSAIGPVDEGFLAIYDAFPAGAPDWLRAQARDAVKTLLIWMRVSWGQTRYDPIHGVILSWDQIRQWGLYGRPMY